MSHIALFLLAALASLSPVRWKINTHLFAANKALADALNDGMVSIPPFGELPVSASALRALRAEPSAYRAGVLAPDLFPDMYVGGWLIHSDLSANPGDRWMAKDWMEYVWRTARGWSDAGERDKVLAFAYGFLTHAAGDMWAHTYVNQKADGAWVTFYGPSKSTAIKHIVLEGYVGAHTPSTDLTLDVWPRFVSNVLIKSAEARQHSAVAKHYKQFLEIYDWLEPLIARAKHDMNQNISNDAPYWAKCALHPVACARKEQMETWRLDISRGLRALVDSSQSLGEKLMQGETAEGAAAMSGWMVEWIPKMFGAHAIGEGAAALQAFLSWVGGVAAPITEPIKAETERYFKQHFAEYYDLYQAAKDPASYMDQLGFPPGTRDSLNRDMGTPGGSGDLDWRRFEPLYNTVILSKLALLDGNGLNELARRAGVTQPLFAPGENTNIMLGAFRSLTQSFQWMGQKVMATTTFGICGPETGAELKKDDWCGVPGGFPLWYNQQARDSVFNRIFKGYGPGPGSTSLTDMGVTFGAAAPGVAGTARALRLGSDQTDYMREIVVVMQGKVAGVAEAAGAAPVVPARTPTSPALPQTRAPTPPLAITDWGQRCCARDIAELRAALIRIQRGSQALGAGLQQLGRQTSGGQIGTLLGQLDAALTAFANTRDAATATAALANLSRGLDILARMVTGT